MKVFLTLLFFSVAAFADGTSILTNDAEVTGFGKIRFRPPVNQNDKKPIVLFHGIYGGASHRTWKKLTAELDKAGEKVFVMDLPGVGESDKPKRAYSMADFDLFVENFLVEVVKERATIVSESILSNGVLRVSATRPDLVRRAVVLSPSGIYSLNEGPSKREQALYDRLYNNDFAGKAFYRTLLVKPSLRYFLKFAFFNDELVNEELLADFSVLKDNVDQRFLSLSFVGGQLYRTFEESSKDVFIPVLAVFGKEYEAFQDNKIARAKDFAAIRPAFTYVEIEESGSSVQREKPAEVAKQIIDFSVLD